MNLMNFITLIKTYRQLKRQWRKSSIFDIRQRQEKDLLSLVQFAKDHSPFYRDLYKDYPITSLTDFKKLPVINKQIMMSHFDALNTVGVLLEDAMKEAIRREIEKEYLGYYKDEFVLGLSSGTSGNKGLYLTPKSLTQLVPAVFLARGGVDFRDLPARIMFVLRVFSQGFQDINAPFLHLQYMPSMTPPQTMIETLKRQKTTILMIPPSVLRTWLPYADSVPQLKKIITYAEVLEKDEKARFEEVFHTRLFEIYQASEGQLASPCSKGELHINEDLVYVELYDAQGVEVTTPEQVATSMIVTNLVNRAQPLIRYQMNDLLQLGGPCACGTHYRHIDHVIGRHDDILIFKNKEGHDRAVFPDLMSRWIITTDDAIREFIVTQKSNESFHLQVDIMGPNVDKIVEKLRERLTNELANFEISPFFDIEIISIKLPVDNRKLKRFISEIRQ